MTTLKVVNRLLEVIAISCGLIGSLCIHVVDDINGCDRLCNSQTSLLILHVDLVCGEVWWVRIRWFKSHWSIAASVLVGNDIMGIVRWFGG